MMARRFSIVPGPRIVALARSRQGAARRHPSARSRAASTRALAMSPGTGRHRSVRAIAPRSQTRRDAVRPSQAHPQAWSPTASWPARRTGRVHAGSHRTEPAPARQAGRQATADGRCMSCLDKAVHDLLVNAAPPHRRWMIRDRFRKSRKSLRLQSPTSATKSALIRRRKERERRGRAWP